MNKSFKAHFIYKNKNNNEFIFLFIMIIIIQQIFNDNLDSPNITLIIKGDGYRDIFGNQVNASFDKKSFPSSVKINEVREYIENYNYNFDSANTTVELFWNNNSIDCKYMFNGCKDILEINFPNFDTQNCKTMSYMFNDCELLTSLNVSTFDTSEVIDMSNMFSNCISLTSLNLATFDTSKVTNMSNLFSNCENIYSLNLSNFDTTKVISIDNMFNGCKNLSYIYIKKFQEYKLNDEKNFFNEVQKNIFLLSKEIIILYQYSNEKKEDISLYTINCSINRVEIINNMSCTCNENCSYHEQCCSDKNLDEICEYKNDTCLICETTILEQELCNKTNDNNEEYLECYNNYTENYIDKIDSAFKNCFFTCETCEKESGLENNNKLKCYSEIIIGNSNCYTNCSFYYYFDNETNFQCNQNQACPKEYSVIFAEKKECIKKDFDYLITELIKIKKNGVTKNEETSYYDSILKNIDLIFTSENFDTFKIDKGENAMINIDKIKILFKTLNNSKDDYYKEYNYTKLNLGECETLLRSKNNISDGEVLYLKQIEIEQDGLRVKKIEYDIYYRSSTSNLTKLDISVCQNTKITMSIPIKLSGNIDILNLSSGYYNDVCYTSTSDSGTDIIIKDRQGEFKEGKKTICQEDCDFSSYDIYKEEANCSCYPKQSSSSYADMNIDMDKICKKFIDITNILNIKILKCHHTLFRKEGIVRNLAFYLILIFIIFHIFTIIIFFYRLIKGIKDKIKNIVFGINYWYLINEGDKVTAIKNVRKLSNNFFLYYLDDVVDKVVRKKLKNKRETNIKKENHDTNNYTSNLMMTVQGVMDREKIIIKVKKIMAYNDEEMNNLSYNLALKYDKRTYFQYYFSLLKTNHVIFFTFYKNKNDYNSKIIKINLFFVEFIVELFVNALFFSDDTMHKIYEDEGDFNFLYQLPQIILSTLISKVFNWLFNNFALSEANIIDFKSNKSTKHLKKRSKKLFFWLRVKFIIYFIISSILVLFFWYYLAMFCAIYRNTQSHLIKDTLLSFVLSLLYPFVIYLLPGIFRIRSLSDKDSKKKYIYNFSIILQNICGFII